MQLSGKTIAITGGAQGIGRAIAERFLKEGAKLALIDLKEENLQKTKEELATGDASIATYCADVSDEQQVEAVFKTMESELGGVDILVNNAGIIKDGMLVSVDADGKVKKTLALSDWQKVIDINLTGVFLCGRAAAASMINHKKTGVIVNISSLSRAGNIGQSNYSASKAGVAALTTTWAKELAHFGIRCAAVAPGFINTDMTAHIKPEIIDKVVHTIPLHQMGSPDQIADAVCFIATNDYITGRIIEVDGGMRI